MKGRCEYVFLLLLAYYLESVEKACPYLGICHAACSCDDWWLGYLCHQMVL